MILDEINSVEWLLPFYLEYLFLCSAFCKCKYFTCCYLFVWNKLFERIFLQKMK